MSSAKDFSLFKFNPVLARYLLEQKFFTVIYASIEERVDYTHGEPTTIERMIDDFILRGSKNQILFMDRVKETNKLQKQTSNAFFKSYEEKCQASTYVKLLARRHVDPSFLSKSIYNKVV